MQHCGYKQCRLVCYTSNTLLEPIAQAKISKTHDSRQTGIDCLCSGACACPCPPVPTSTWRRAADSDGAYRPKSILPVLAPEPISLGPGLLCCVAWRDVISVRLLSDGSALEVVRCFSTPHTRLRPLEEKFQWGGGGNV